MTPGFQNTLGVILAGGQSRRMEGVEKSLMKLHGEPLIKRVAAKLGKQVPQILVNANGDPQRFSFLDLPVQSDTVSGHVGPLAGVLAAMRWAETHAAKISHVLTAASDTPFFPNLYAKSMHEAALAENADIALAISLGRRHPVFGLWPVRLADALERFLVTENERKVMLFAERYATCEVSFNQIETPQGVIDPFFNVNTPEDLEQAELIAADLVMS